jgi:aminoglycoside phosphotransferase (APT) family kinase protein
MRRAWKNPAVPEPMPEAEVRIDEALVRELLWEQASDLADLPLSRFAHGWDNVLLRLGADLLVRLPRRQVAAELIRHEQRWLPQLASSLPLPVPVPLMSGVPGAGYPWHWTVTPIIPGRSPSAEDELDHHRVAEQLGEFLGRLHQAASPLAPANPFRGIPLAQRQETFDRTLISAGPLIDTDRAAAVWEDAVSAKPWQGRPLWLHGDLHPGNMLVEEGRLTGVVDFGDITSGDPACDLSAVWMLVDEAQHEAFWLAYAAHADKPDNGGDGDLRRRARGWALALGAIFLVRSADNPTMTAIGRRTLDAVLKHG